MRWIEKLRFLALACRARRTCCCEIHATVKSKRTGRISITGHTSNATTQRPGKVTHFVRRNDYDRDFRGATHLPVGSFSELLQNHEEYGPRGHVSESQEPKRDLYKTASRSRRAIILPSHRDPLFLCLCRGFRHTLAKKTNKNPH